MGGEGIQTYDIPFPLVQSIREGGGNEGIERE